MSRWSSQAWLFALVLAIALLLAYPAGASVGSSATASPDCNVGSDRPSNGPPARCGYDLAASRTTRASAPYRTQFPAYDGDSNITQPRALSLPSLPQRKQVWFSRVTATGC